MTANTGRLKFTKRKPEALSPSLRAFEWSKELIAADQTYKILYSQKRILLKTQRFRLLITNCFYQPQSSRIYQTRHPRLLIATCVPQI